MTHINKICILSIVGALMLGIGTQYNIIGLEYAGGVSCALALLLYFD